MLLARLNFGLARKAQEEIDLYNHFIKKHLFRTESTKAKKLKFHEQRKKNKKISIND